VAHDACFPAGLLAF